MAYGKPVERRSEASQSDLNNAWAGVPLAGRLYRGGPAALRLPRLSFSLRIKIAF